ncbi:MAG: dTDP-4-dehydrorhamnose 3,5-epimerase [Chthoniobacterales bacterium]|nr:dTDP-4-dehydrorhamnose 3,5-epimerase [Chthoniobacterales bacterium]
MKVTKTSMEGLLILEPMVFGDERGFFYESYNQRDFLKKVGLDVTFVQANHSHSVQGVLRGLHYQVKQPQGKLVSVIRGKIFDVVVDLRQGSSTFGKWESFELSEENRKQLWIPPGFAHGFLTLSKSGDVLYKTTDYYAPEHERTLAWNDPEISVSWPLEELGEFKLSEKDGAGISLEKAKEEILY